MVMYLGWASFFQLHTVCLFCATTYVAVVAIFICRRRAEDPV